MSLSRNGLLLGRASEGFLLSTLLPASSTAIFHTESLETLGDSILHKLVWTERYEFRCCRHLEQSSSHTVSSLFDDCVSPMHRFSDFAGLVSWIGMVL
jgi:hypothetical protein